MADPTYSTASDLRTELGVDSSTLPDADANRLLLSAEDITDSLLGSWTPDDDTGRKIVQDDIEGWQWVKLQRFVNLLAAAMYDDPDLANGRQWASQSGPDFTTGTPIGSPIPASVLAVLNDTGLRRLAGRARRGHSHPLVDSFFRSPTSWRLR